MFSISSISNSRYLILTVDYGYTYLAIDPQYHDWLKVTFIWQGLTSGAYTSHIIGQYDRSLTSSTILKQASSSTISVLSTNAARNT